MTSVLDAIAGTSILLMGIFAWRRFRTSALFALAAAGAWFVVPAVPELVLLHRPLLIHSFLTLPRSQVGGAGARLLLTVAWVGVVLPPVVQPWVSVIAAALCIAVAAGLQAHKGTAVQRDLVAARRALFLLGAGLALPMVERAVWPAYADAELPMATYLCAVTLASAAVILGILTPSRQETDAVIELFDRTPGETLGEFRRLALVETDPRRSDAIRSAVALLEDNARLQRELAERIGEVRASRARLIDTAIGERQRLERVLADGALRYLGELETCLRSTAGNGPEPAVARCMEEIFYTREDLEQLARGLHPRILSERGLAAALDELSRSSPLPVEVAAPTERFPATVETTIWYACAEAVANVLKHAQATRAVIHVVESGGLLTASVHDDGIGGARLSAAGGLTGLVDRLSNIGGQLALASTRAGTHVTITVPLP